MAAVSLSVSTQALDLEQWLRHELAQHALEGHINVLPSDKVAVTVTGQPNAITAFVYRCQYAAMGIQHVALSDL